MSTGGFDERRLTRLDEILTEHVEKGGVPGVTWIISRGGEVHHGAVGSAVVGGEPIGRDAIFRIASMSKAVTAVAALILVEECRIRLDDPVDAFLPELAERKVLRTIASPLDDVVPAVRPITVRDLLTFTFGFGALFAEPGTHPILDAATELGVAVGPPRLNAAPAPEPDEWMRRLGSLPLMHQPGTRWMYHTGSAVLGVLIARASGRPFEEFLRERIFTPLGMKDTAFSVPPEKRGRFTTAYWAGPSGELAVYDGPDGKWAEPSAFADGGGDLVSTIDDFHAFAGMLRGGGVHKGERILGRTSVADMTGDRLLPGLAPEDFILGPGYGWGYGVAVAGRRLGPAVTEGQYGWDGGLGTSWKNDPREGLTGIVLTNRMFSSASAPPVIRDFWTSVYRALDD